MSNWRRPWRKKMHWFILRGSLGHQWEMLCWSNYQWIKRYTFHNIFDARWLLYYLLYIDSIPYVPFIHRASGEKNHHMRTRHGCEWIHQHHHFHSHSNWFLMRSLLFVAPNVFPSFSRFMVFYIGSDRFNAIALRCKLLALCVFSVYFCYSCHWLHSFIFYWVRESIKTHTHRGSERYWLLYDMRKFLIFIHRWIESNDALFSFVYMMDDDHK